ncbi:cytochrome c oxidase copper chaperone [Umbelopsis sp. PMI_123]|nr:cytochrome c oxidase copper chaperone [Umbelopsis sp. PMI_123]
MSQQKIATTSTHSGELPIGADGKPLKPCCACPETKKVRDRCIFDNGEENCKQYIDAHVKCMRDLGFKI